MNWCGLELAGLCGQSKLCGLCGLESAGLCGQSKLCGLCGCYLQVVGLVSTVWEV